MPTFAPGYLRPGFYLQQQNVSPPTVAQGIRISGIIGQGSKTLGRSQVLTKGAVTNGQDGPLSFNTVINVVSIKDKNNVVYRQGIDFQLTRVSSQSFIDWSLKASLTGTVALTSLTLPGALNTLHFKFVKDGVNQDVAFDGSVTTPALVASFINTFVGDPSFASLNASNQLVLTSNSIVIQQSSAMTVLGFVVDQNASVQKPAAGVTYTVLYNSDKLPSDYGLQLFTSIQDVVTYAGEKRPQVLIDSGNVVSSTTGAWPFTITVQTANTYTANQLAGDYLKITGGTGKGQVRVIIANTVPAAGQMTLTLSQDWSPLLAPDSSSTYSLTDVNDNSISKGSQICADAGGTAFMVSQYADDIFNTTNIKAAIDAYQGDVAGQRAYCLTLMRGLGSTEVDPINYLINHVNTESDVLHDRWKTATVGLAKGNDSFLTYITLANGMNSDRVFIQDIADGFFRDFGTGITENLDGSYGAAALNGIICTAEDAGAPMTGRTLGTAFSVSAFTDPFTIAQKNLMGAAGVVVFERRGTDLVMVDDLTTNPSTILTKYIRFTRMKDEVSRLIKTGLEKFTVGQRFVKNPQGGSDIIGRTKGNFNFIIGSLSGPPNPIVDHVENLIIKADTVDPTQLDITANVFLVGEVKYVFALIGFAAA